MPPPDTDTREDPLPASDPATAALVAVAERLPGAERLPRRVWRAVCAALRSGREVPGLAAALVELGGDQDSTELLLALIERSSDAPHDVPRANHAWLLGRHAAALVRARVQAERFHRLLSDAVDRVVHAGSVEDVHEQAVAMAIEVTGLDAGAVYVPSDERVWFTSAVRERSEDGPELPARVRIDRGIVADVLAAERAGEVVGGELAEEFAAAGCTRVVVAPLRDAARRPLGVLVAASRTAEPGTGASTSAHAGSEVQALAELAVVVEGSLNAANASRRMETVLTTLPELVEVSDSSDESMDAQLDLLAAIAARATDSDGAVVRLCDPAGRLLETRAVYSRQSDVAGDLIGTRTDLRERTAQAGEVGATEFEHIDGIGELGWSESGQRILSVLGARSLACFPIVSRYDQPGVLYLTRRTARPFDPAVRASARVVALHMQHVIDRGIADAQTARAIDAASSAIGVLGEALVAGVRTEQTLRFVPRLFNKMFDTAGCRVWRRERDGELTLLAGAGQFQTGEPDRCVEQAFEQPLELRTGGDGAIESTAIAIDQFDGSRVAIECQLFAERAFGQEEQRLVTEVAGRVAEALYSAAQSAAHQRQIERVRNLQGIISTVHAQLDEQHVLTSLVDLVAAEYGAQAAGVFLIGERGELELRSGRSLPSQLADAIIEARHWAPDATGDERHRLVAVHALGADRRVSSLRPAVAASGLEKAGALFIPLSGREQTVGCLALVFGSGLPPSIGAEEDRTLAAFGQHVGAALSNARVFEREREARERIERVLEIEREERRQVQALYEVSRTFATSMSLDETMRAVVEAMADRLDIDAVWIRTPEGRGDALNLRAFYAAQPERAAALERMVGAAVDQTDPITTQVVSSRQAVLVTADEAVSGPYASSATIRRLRPFLQRGSTVAVLPIATPNEVLGTVTMLSIDPDNALTWAKVDIAAGVTGQAALALDNARLYKQQKDFADVIQESLLPASLPRVPTIDLGVLYRSATAGVAEVGGDFYDFLELEDGRLALVVGDVTGKGVGAAADTAMTKYIFRALAREHPEPAAFLRYANEVVCEEITPGKFVTLFYAVIDAQAGTLTCGNAGHPEPKLLHDDEGGHPTITSLGMEGLALGILGDQDYEQRTYEFPQRASLIMYTDGVVEARREGRLYGQYRLERRLLEEFGASAPSIAFAVFEDCAAYAAGDLADDVAIVVAQRVRPEAPDHSGVIDPQRAEGVLS